MRHLRIVAAICASAAASSAATPAPKDAAMWTIYVTNDNCPDYTWGYTEKQTRKAFADIVRGHLDEMKRTDGWAEADRDRYNMAVTQEALCFVEHYPERKDELIRRIREGRVYVSPYLCNSLWAFQGVEGALRTFYPARRLERDWGISFEVAEHIEEPSLPWGVASILAGCGIRWLSVPFYKYDSTFTGLRNPPAFAFEGPDGETIRVVMDPWACGRHSYMQGARLLRGGQAAASQWVAHYARMGKDYPARAILASGTHGDISPASGGQARQYAEAIRKHNAQPPGRPRLVNAALPQFCTAIDAAHAHAPFLQTIRGSFGHSWDLWPVCLARYVADMREGARRMLAAEALLALAAHRRPGLHQATRADRERAEWCWAMLSDHAWNGTNDQNKRHNADLRRDWGRELNRIAGELTRRGWAALGIRPAGDGVALFNSLSLARRGPVRVDAAAGGVAAFSRDAELPSQVVREDGTSRLYFLSPEVAGFGVEQVSLRAGPRPKPGAGRLHATPQRLESPYYRLRLDPKTGGFASVVHKPTGAELVAPGSRRRLCQTIYYTDREHVLEDVRSEVTAAGPVLARLRVTGRVHGIDVTNCVTVYGELDRVDFDLRVHKPPTREKQRLCHAFPVVREGSALRIETTGAVIRPRPAPDGDLLPGADARRFAVQGFVDASPPNGVGVTIAPLDAFALRTDLKPITFEALGNDQNYREVVQDQHGVRDFRFRYALRAHRRGYRRADAFAWSRDAATPLVAAAGRLPRRTDALPSVTVDPARAIATCLKPADDPAGGCILRLWETGGRSGPVRIGVKGFATAARTDLLERDLKALEVAGGGVRPALKAHGFAAVRLRR